jgi:hypothetical protein
MFHPMSLLIPFMVLIPNLMFISLQPRNMPKAAEDKENWMLTAAERMGQIGVFIIPVLSPIHTERVYEVMSLMGMLIFILIYYFGWLRYIRGGREYSLLFAPMMGIPVPLAISPVVYFLLASVVLHSSLLLICTIIFAVGHIAISIDTYKRIGDDTRV